jgi:hypothetical protein
VKLIVFCREAIRDTNDKCQQILQDLDALDVKVSLRPAQQPVPPICIAAQAGSNMSTPQIHPSEAQQQVSTLTISQHSPTLTRPASNASSVTSRAQSTAAPRTSLELLSNKLRKQQSRLDLTLRKLQTFIDRGESPARVEQAPNKHTQPAPGCEFQCQIGCRSRFWRLGQRRPEVQVVSRPVMTVRDPWASPKKRKRVCSPIR